MKANDLRLGNLIYNTRGEVDTVNIDALKYLLNYPGTLCQAEPIPLTQEWCLRLNFLCDADGFYSLKTLNHLLLTWNIYERILRFDSNEVLLGSFVHVVQNLYFYTTGNELEIK